MGNVFDELLAGLPRGPIRMDGGMGTTSEDRGIDTRTHLWGSFALLTPEGREINDGIHRDFAAAGAQILIANTHAAFRRACGQLEPGKDFQLPDLEARLVGKDVDQRAEAIHDHVLRTAVHSARSAIPRGRLVAVATCIGSVDTPYATEATVSADEAADILEVEVAARLKAGGDLLLFETLTTPEEIQGAASAAARCKATHVAAGLTCGADGRTLAGVTMEEATRAFAGVSPKAYFVQCTRYDLVERALDALLKAVGPTDTVGVYANDGRHWDHTEMKWSGDRVTPEKYAEHAARWRDMGARIIGGCCGTGPEHIARLST